MTHLAIIGGTGLTDFEDLIIDREERVDTPYGEPSAPISFGQLDGQPVVFMPRHGSGHRIPPHCVNYRANIWALQSLGIKQVVAVNAVGGIDRTMGPTHVVLPDQLIDYSYGREHTYFDSPDMLLQHVDMTYPYHEPMRQVLADTAVEEQLAVTAKGTYGCTQGPRLETAAEVARMARDGCAIVGQTGMPEAGLARELDLQYVSVCLVVNWAAGITDELITMDEIRRALDGGMAKVRQLIVAALPRLLQLSR